MGLGFWRSQNSNKSPFLLKILSFISNCTSKLVLPYCGLFFRYVWTTKRRSTPQNLATHTWQDATNTSYFEIEISAYLESYRFFTTVLLEINIFWVCKSIKELSTLKVSILYGECIWINPNFKTLCQPIKTGLRFKHWVFCFAPK